MHNSFGHIFRITTFGESHGRAVGLVLDGCPAGLPIDLEFIQAELDRRRPGQSRLTSQRKETDTVQVLSGVFEGISTGAPIALMVENQDARSKDYDHLAQTFRPGHADFTWTAKYGMRDHRGGGRSSARETLARVAAGAIAKTFLKQNGISVQSWVSQVGPVVLNKPYQNLDLSLTETNDVRCPDPETAAAMEELIDQTRKNRDTVGGVLTCLCTGVPAGLGEPVFGKLHAELGAAMLGINAVKGFEYGSGFEGAAMFGSQHNDIFEKKADGRIGTQTNHSGGILGGISNGEDIYMRIAFKPVATLMQDQPSVDLQGEPAVVQGKGRHDPCVLPRAVPIAEAMAALVLADYLLMNRLSRV
ncbi:MAG: chorismate synthase [Bacteroidota bacterium]